LKRKIIIKVASSAIPQVRYLDYLAGKLQTTIHSLTAELSGNEGAGKVADVDEGTVAEDISTLT
jgi:hypothetical protein